MKLNLDFAHKPAMQDTACRSLFVLLTLLMPTVPVHAENLDSVMQDAIEKNAFQKSLQEDQRAMASKIDAARAARLPQVSVAASRVHLNDSPALQIPFLHTQQPLMDDNFNVVHAEVTVPIYTSGRIDHIVKAAGARAAMSDGKALANANNLRLEVATAYFNVLRAQQWVQVKHHHEQSLGSLRDDATKLFDKGFVPHADVLAITVSYANAHQESLSASNTLSLARAAYNQVLNRPLTSPVAIDETDLLPETRDENALYSLALQKRSELQQLRHARRALEEKSKAIVGESGPQVALIGAHDYIDDPYLSHNDINSASIAFKWNLFDGGITRQQARAMRQRANAVGLQREDIQQKIALSIRKGLYDQSDATERLKVAEKIVSYAEESARVARQRYNNGLSTQTEVIQSAAQLAAALANIANAYYDQQMAIVYLKHATGTL